MTSAELQALSLLAHDIRTTHDPTAQANGYNRCEHCHYTRHPCDAYEMADAVLRLLEEPDLAWRT